MTSYPRVEVGIDCINPEKLAPFWAAALGYTVGDFDADDTYLDLVPPSGDRPVVYLQRVTEEKVVKNRVHLDLYDRAPEALIDRLSSLGATTIDVPHTGAAGGWWQVMADPEGNEFCVCRSTEA